MIDPVDALLVAGVFFAVMTGVFWPKKGLLARWQRAKRSTRRVLIEDSLKHLYDCEYRNIVCTRLSVSGALSISGDEAARLLGRLEAMGLVESHGEGFVLTEDGRSYALRVIRVHRLWERYLADETSFGETDWHAEAEEQEHMLTPAQADALAVQMGNPMYDPHGDPIPTASGEIPVKKGKSLTQLRKGSVAEIVHIEDEPEAVYAQLVAQGLNPGIRIRVVDVSRDRIVFEADGVENVLAPIMATNVTVVPLSRETRVAGPFETLASLKPGETAKVVGISPSCRGIQRRRLMDLGVVPGTVISAAMRSAGGDPTAYSIRGASIALREKQANMIHISRQVKEATQ